MAGTVIVDKIQLGDGTTSFQVVSNTGALVLSANSNGLQTGIAANSITYGMISPSILATQNNVYNVESANANTGVGNSTVTFTSNTGAISAGMIVYGAGFGRGTTVSSVVNANTILLSTASANTSTNTRLSFVEPNKLVTAEIVAPGLCKAWVNFNGTGTVAIRGAFNVSSITDNGTGRYKVNLATAMPDANYSVGSGLGMTTNNGLFFNIGNSAESPTLSTTQVPFTSCTAGGTQIDAAHCYIQVFR